MCCFLVQLFFPTTDKIATMFRPISLCHQDDQHALSCSTSFDQEKHLLFEAFVYTSSSYKHNCNRAHSTSHASLITKKMSRCAKRVEGEWGPISPFSLSEGPLRPLRTATHFFFAQTVSPNPQGEPARRLWLYGLGVIADLDTPSPAP